MERSSKNKLELENFGNSQPSQIAEDAKIRRFAVEKAFSGEKGKSVAAQPGASALEGSNFPSIESHRGLFGVKVM